MGEKSVRSDTKRVECAPETRPERALGEKNVRLDTNCVECAEASAHSTRFLAPAARSARSTPQQREGRVGQAFCGYPSVAQYARASMLGTHDPR